ncbi:hypothetical protein LEP1GSC005_2093 [Leptospira santarosai str. ST188]|nr:hypothetical protein LEP1GSC005_2093 [Leptospira santarosai str. ST188]
MLGAPTTGEIQKRKHREEFVLNPGRTKQDEDLRSLRS